MAASYTASCHSRSRLDVSATMWLRTSVFGERSSPWGSGANAGAALPNLRMFSPLTAIDGNGLLSLMMLVAPGVAASCRHRAWPLPAPRRWCSKSGSCSCGQCSADSRTFACCPLASSVCKPPEGYHRMAGQGYSPTTLACSRHQITSGVPCNTSRYARHCASSRRLGSRRLTDRPSIEGAPRMARM